MIRKLSRSLSTWTLTAGLSLLVACGGGGGGGSELPTLPPAPTTPTISTQPAAATVSAGQTATFSVVASGSPTYQWQKDGSNVSGATAASYTTAATSLTDNGAQYRVVVSNSAGSLNSANALLTVNAVVLAPSISVQPQSKAAAAGTVVQFQVVADGTGPFSYQWQRNGNDIAGATASSHLTGALAVADNGSVYRVIVSNSAGQATSANATLTVATTAPAVTGQPVDVLLVAGQTASFGVGTSGSDPLSYQWQRGTTAIGGATASSYSFTSVLSDNGATFRVIVSNPAGSASSTSATLEVSATAIAPTLRVQPQSQTVLEGQSVTFRADARATGPLTYQWLRNGVDIPGAVINSPTALPVSYTLERTTLNDQGARFSVRVSNSAGTATSLEATLTITPAISPFNGRSWASGQSLESSSNAVLATSSAIDDSGRATVLFLQSDGSRNVLWASRGTPGTANTTPTWSTPVAIDGNGASMNGMSSGNTRFGIAASPSGNLLAYWFATAACTAQSYNTSGTCRYWYSARQLANASSWEAPVLLGAFPDGEATALINDSGEAVLMLPGWAAGGNAGYSPRVAVARRAAGDSAFTVQTLADGTLSGARLGLDHAGNLLLAANASANNTVDVVSYRGTAAAGLGAALVVDNLASAAQLQLAKVGKAGHQIIVWTQNNGSNDVLIAASSLNATNNWTVRELRLRQAGSRFELAIDDDGIGYLYDLANKQRFRFVGGLWDAEQAMPATTPNGSSEPCALTRNGDLMCVDTAGSGKWATYDAKRNIMVQDFVNIAAGPDLVLGTTQSGKNVGMAAPVVSAGGYAIVTMINGYSALPSQAAPSGTTGAATNAWASFFK